MNIQKLTRLLTVTGCLLLTTMVAQAAEGGYSFKVHNTTKDTMTKLLVSEDGGKTWGGFDIGKGIAAGETAKLVWDSSTDNSGCDFLVKAVYSDGSEAEAAKFNFCEKDLELEF